MYLPEQWDIGLVIMSIFVIFHSIFTTISILPTRIWKWQVILASFIFSVSGVWSMHFIGMSARLFPLGSLMIPFDKLEWVIVPALIVFILCTAAFLIMDSQDIRETATVTPEGMKMTELNTNMHALRQAPHGVVISSMRVYHTNENLLS